MARGTEVYIKLRLQPNLQAVDPDYIIKSLIKLSSRKADNLVPAARIILQKIATRGDKGLYSTDWKQTCKELNLTQAQYFTIIRAFKKAGLIYKSRGRFGISKTFKTHMTKYASTISSMLMDLGVD